MRPVSFLWAVTHPLFLATLICLAVAATGFGGTSGSPATTTWLAAAFASGFAISGSV